MSNFKLVVPSEKVISALLAMDNKKLKSAASNIPAGIFVLIEHGYDHLGVWFVTVYDPLADIFCEFFHGSSPMYMGERVSLTDLTNFHNAIDNNVASGFINCDLPY